MGTWRNYKVRRNHYGDTLSVVVILTTLHHGVMVDTVDISHNIHNNDTIGRTFGNLVDSEPVKSSYADGHQREMTYYDQSWPPPKFVSPNLGDMALNLNGPNINHKYYTDFTEKEYDNYGHSDEHYNTHEYISAPPHHSIMIKNPPTMTSRLSELFSMDALKILLLLIMKLLLIKLKAITFMKILILTLIKLPIVVAAFIFKILFFIKLTNFFKIITLPLFLPIILLVLGPLIIFLPLLLLPFLIPLLLFLPIPILTFTTPATTTTTTTQATGRRRRRRRYLDGSDLNSDFQSTSKQIRSTDGNIYYSDLLYFKYIIESEQCLERIACKLAADKKSTIFKSYIASTLDVIKEYLLNPRLHSYVSAYKTGTTFNTTFAKCGQYYPCRKF